LDAIPQWAYKNYFTIATGDFNGDGKDEIAVYVPKANSPYIAILDGSNLSVKKELPLKNLMGRTGAELSTKMKADDSTARSTIQVSMTADDIDRDGNEDLLVVGSYPDIVNDKDGKELTERSSVFGFYKGASDLNLERQNVLTKSSDSTEVVLNGATIGKVKDDNFGYVRTASITTGDIDNNGFPEIIIAGLYSKQTANNTTGEDLDKIERDTYSVTTLAYNPRYKENDVEVGKLSLGTTQIVNWNNFTKDGYYKNDAIQGAPAITCAAVNGRNAADELFLSGTFYKLNGDGEWQADHTPAVCDEADNGIAGWIITNTWVDQCVAGNFDSNELGIEQVMFTTGYKQTVLSYYFYRAYIAGKKTKTENEILQAGDYYTSMKGCDYLSYHQHKNNKPCASVAAVDIDQDTDTFTYKSKEFTHSNVEVQAVLQAAPYFEDIYDDYYDAVGETSFGIVKGSGGATSTTQKAKAGAYVNFAAGTQALKFTVEATFTHEWEWEYENELTNEFVYNFVATDTNMVVLYRTPVTLYHYTVTPADGSKQYDMVIGIQEDPKYCLMDVDVYNSIAENDPALKDKMITSDVISNQPGRPDTYPGGTSGLNECVAGETKTISNTYSGSSFTQFEINSQTTSTASQSYFNEFELSLGVAGEASDPLGIVDVEYGCGVSAGGGWGGGSSVISYEGVTKGGSIANPPKTECPYSFEATFATWSAKLGDTTVPVVGYVVSNVQMPPSPPRNLSIDTVTDHSITVGWELGGKVADKFEIYQYFDDGITNNPYSFLDSVPGDTTTYTFDGLDPSTTYSLALRSIGRDGTTELVSEFTEPVTATTLSREASPTVVDVTKEQNVVVGDDATFKIEASPSVGTKTGLSYTWQRKDPNKSNWKNFEEPNEKRNEKNAKEFDYVDSVGNTYKSSTLKIENVTKDMDGDYFRCVVAEIHNGVRTYTYSDVGVLNVGKANTTTNVTVLNSATSQNTGYSDTKERVEGTGTTKENKIVEITIGTTSAKYEIYNNEDTSSNNTIPFVYRNLNNGKFYILKNVNETAKTADSASEVTHKERYVTIDGKNLNFDEFYQKTNEKEDVEITEKEYITKTVTVNNVTTTYQVYEYTDETVNPKKTYNIYKKVVANNTQKEDDTYYTIKESTNPVTVTEIAIHSDEPGQYKNEDGTTTVIPGEIVQIDKNYTTYTDNIIPGDETTITIKVKKNSTLAAFGNGAVISIYNSLTGDLKTIPATVDANGNATTTWTPENEGIYTITAEYSGSDTTKASSGKAVYYATSRTDESIYVVHANDSTYGDSVTLETFKGTKDANGKITEEPLPNGTTVKYYVQYKNDDGVWQKKDIGTNHTYYPTIAGEHTFFAEINDSTTAPSKFTKTRMNVNKRPLLVTAPTKLNISAENTADKVPSLNDLIIINKNDETKPAITPDDKTNYPLESIFKYVTEPTLDENSAEGIYSVTPAFNDSTNENKAKAAQFQNRYDVKFKSGTFTIVSDVCSVTYDSSINGSLQGYYGDNQVGFISGTGIYKGTNVSLLAFPDEGFTVTKWTITDLAGNDLTAGTDYQLVDEKIIIDSLEKDIIVHAEFGMTEYELSYGAGEHGNLSANYINGNTKTSSIVSPEPVPFGKKVVLTATPDNGYVVKAWKISKNGGTLETIENADGSNYSGNEYELTIDDNIYVYAEFEKEAFYTVDAQFISDESIVGCSFNIEGTGNDGKAKKASTIKLTATIPDVVIIKEWRLYTDDQKYTVLQGGLDSYTITNVQSDLKIRVVLAGYKTNNLTFKAVDENGDEIPNVITAACGKQTLKSGNDYVAYIPVSFNAVIPKEYVVAKWGLKDVASNTETAVASGKEALSYTLPSLDKVYVLTLYLEKLPTSSEMTFEGKPIDVSTLFSLDTSIGTPLYELINDQGTGVGTLTDSALTVTKTGDFLITAKIVDNDGKQIKAPVKHILTVKKGTGNGSITVNDITVGEQLVVNTESATNGSTTVNILYKPANDETAEYSEKVPHNKGSYTVKAVFAENDLYNGFEAVSNFNIDPSPQTNSNNSTLNIGARIYVNPKNVKVTWGKLKEAEGYDIFAQQCGIDLELQKSVNAKTTKYEFKKISGKKVEGKHMYKVVVKAFKMIDNEKVYIGETLDLHGVGKANKQYTDIKLIKVNKTDVSLKAGKSLKLKTKVVKANKNEKALGKEHASPIRYFSTNDTIATVSDKGRIKAVKKGSCYVYVFGMNGVKQKVKVTVTK
jgi:hypothetical protein